ncbi:GGDEF domain-containing protein [Desulfolutivibrio sulfoxidireducens]|uniref:GGDEF domain-containing protein n=1 Tax=Desulfolutivibrio sulfoxidireducens TaxID=2773299 RepID=UPI00159DFCE9|nr:GGDEF domain-containing protein [Desulfolutivibrio sulfoxidireducens]QLA16971.1 diguanylate cyclase [Desulfolutivibrio sulfoxidireducens]QLA20537.1 diguanylate cyclase [Desulfolutivibrio sulfoxidireducens]
MINRDVFDLDERLARLARHAPERGRGVFLQEIEAIRGGLAVLSRHAAEHLHACRILEDEAVLLRARVDKLADTRRRLLEHLRRDTASFRKFREAIKISRGMRSLSELPVILPRIKDVLDLADIGLVLCAEEFADFLPGEITPVPGRDLARQALALCPNTPARPFLGPSRSMPDPSFLLDRAQAGHGQLLGGSCFACGLRDKFHRDRVIGAVAFFDPDPGRYTPDKATDFLEHFCEILASDLINVRDHEKLDREKVLDELTGAPNRAYLTRHAPRMLEFSGRKGFPVCALFIDLDRFKAINDTLGHEAGDRVLTAVSARLKDAMRRYDIFARLGGDEFVAILPDTDLPEAAALADRIRRAVAGLDVARATGTPTPLTVSASVGIARHQPGEGLDDLIRRADADMYTVKRGEISPESPA